MLSKEYPECPLTLREGVSFLLPTPDFQLSCAGFPVELSLVDEAWETVVLGTMLFLPSFCGFASELTRLVFENFCISLEVSQVGRSSIWGERHK